MRKLALLSSFLLLCLLTQAQTVLKSNRELLLEDMNRASHTMHHYEALDTTDTPAPEGFVPFYISHIGRHGSRFEDSISYYDRYIKKFEEYDAKGVLTEDGKWLLHALIAVRDTTKRHLGELTSLGAREHQEIAGRMLRRFPEVWNQEKRTIVQTFSTASPRVLESRMWFLSVLRGACPDHTIKEYQTGEEFGGMKVAEFVNGKELSEEDKIKVKNIVYHMEVPDNPYPVSWRRLAEKTFTDPDNHRSSEVRELMAGAFTTIGFAQCIEGNMPRLEEYFTPEEAYCFWYSGNYDRYNGTITINKANKGIPAKKIIPIVESWISFADEAIRGNKVAADLRFSHDSQIQPMLSLIGATGNDVIAWPSEIGDNWCTFTSICMATNIQMIFYKSPDSKDILVKMLHNEREVVIPSLPVVNGVYQNWKDMKKYLDKRMKAVAYGTICK